MTVAELIKLLETYPQDMLVAYDIYSESCLLEESDIRVAERCYPREDCWLERYRPDKPYQKYLMFPGN